MLLGVKTGGCKVVFILATASRVVGALAVPSGPWHLTFALGWLGNNSFYIEILYAGHPGIFLIEHSLLQMYSVCAQQTVEFKTVNE